jgi:hypothetical protein
MGCTYEFMGKVYTEKQFKLLLKDKGVQNKIKILMERESFSPFSVEDDDFSFEEDADEDMDFKTNFEKTKDFKKSLVTLYKNRISNLNTTIEQIKDSDPNTAKRYGKLQVKLQNRIVELEAEISKLSKENPLTLAELRYQALEDFQRVYELLNSGKLGDDPVANKEIFENAEEAKRIINFYKAMEITQTNQTIDGINIDSHPLFFDHEIYDPVTKRATVLPDEVQQILNQIAADFKKHEVQLNGIYKEIVTTVVNSNPRVKKMYDTMTYDEIVKALPDANMIDMLLMDISKGIFSNNGTLPQVIMDAFQANWAEHIGEYKSFEEKHNTALVKVEKVLRQLKQTLSGLFLNKEVSFDLFFQRSKTGKRSGKLTQRYTSDFSDFKDSFMAQYNQEVNIAFNTEEIGARSKRLLRAFDKKKTWFRENTITFDLGRMQEIQDEFPEFAEFFKDDDGYTDNVKSNISAIGYKEELEGQKKSIRNFLKWKQLYTETFLEQRGVGLESELEMKDFDQLQMDIMAHNPFISSANINSTSFITYKGLVVNPTYKYNYSIPRKFKAVTNRKLSADSDTYVMEETTTPTGYYDESFKVIEAHSELKEYYDLISEEMDNIMKQFPEEIRSRLFSNSLPMVKKAITEIYADPNISFFKKLIKMAAAYYQELKMGFGINAQESNTYDNVDIITNQREPKVNSAFISDNKQEVDKRSRVEMIKFAKLHGKPVNHKSSIAYSELSSKAVKYLTDLLELSDGVELKKKYGESIPVGQIIEKAIMANIVEEHSVNLPKIIKYYSKMAHEYNARQEMLPYINILKNHYGKTGKSVKTSMSETLKINGKTEIKGLRNKAISQFEDWYNRVVLGNQGDIHLTASTLPLNERKGLTGKLMGIVSGRLLTFKDQKLKKELDKMINEESNPVLKKELEDIRESLGKRASFEAVFTNLLSHITFINLGFSIKSAITNFIEGQIANLIIASTGDHFQSKHFYRAAHIVSGSFIKSIFGNKSRATPNGAKKASLLINKFDILQDATNELQKASTKTPFSKVNAITPMQLTKRTEYMNQTPLMVAIMLDTPIKGISGKESNVWDALDVDGKLKPDFRTEENILAWEQNKGETYTLFRTKVTDAIVTAHGNYDQLRGMMLKSNVVGKALIMFKTWLSMQIYGRIAFEHDDLVTGQKGKKGRYWSHTKASGAIHGALTGVMMIGGGWGIGIGAVAGLGLASIFGVRSNLNIAQSSILTLKLLMRKFIATPINLLSGRELINENSGYEKLLSDGKFTERDLRNMKSLMADLSMTLAWISFTILAHAKLWDDDDEEDSNKRKWHNLLVNRGLQLSQSATMYTNPIDLYKNMVSNNGVMTYITDVNKFLKSAGKWFDGQVSNSDQGEKFRKIILPSLFRDSYMGFGKESERVFTEPIFDQVAWDEERIERKVVSAQREDYRKELENLPEGKELSKKQIDDLVNRRHPLPKDIKDTTSKNAKKSVKPEKVTPKERMERRSSFKEQSQKILLEKKKKMEALEKEQSQDDDLTK